MNYYIPVALSLLFTSHVLGHKRVDLTIVVLESNFILKNKSTLQAGPLGAQDNLLGVVVEKGDRFQPLTL